MARVMVIGAMLAMSAQPAGAQQESGCPELIVQTFGSRAPQACRVSFCESTWRSWAVSPNGQNLGYFQINRIHGWRASTDPETNVAFAYELSNGGRDWSSWACKP